MPKMTYNREIKDVLDSFLLDNVEVEPGKAFGLPAYYINRKMFACVYEDGATIKVPAERAVELLRREGVREFAPMGDRVMKNWVLLTHEDPDDFTKDTELFDEAMSYVYSLTKEERAE